MFVLIFVCLTFDSRFQISEALLLCEQPRWPRRNFVTCPRRRPLLVPSAYSVLLTSRSHARLSPLPSHSLVHPHPNRRRAGRADATPVFPGVKQTLYARHPVE